MITERCPPPDWSECDEVGSWERSCVALAERVEYLMLVASDVGDSGPTPQEAARLERLCRDFELPDLETERVLAAAHAVWSARSALRRLPGRSGNEQ